MINKLFQEPCLDTLKRMPNNFLDCVITSPPYWQLRDYGYEGQWGLEPTFQGYLEHLWSMMDEIYRVLKPQGTCWINLGDTYHTHGCGSKKSTHNFQGAETATINGIGTIKKPLGDLPEKCLLLIPHRFAIGCIDLGWIMRNDCIWAKRNGMPESVTDRFTKKHEYFFFMVKSEKYFFDLDAIRKPLAQSSIQRLNQNIEQQNGSDRVPNKSNGNMKAVGKTKIPVDGCEGYGSPRARNNREDTTVSEGNYLGSNPGSVSDFWDIPTKPSKEKHYASYNDSLLVKPVLAGCPEGGIIYDPFMGTGSTAEVAIRSNRNFIGSEMSAEYCKIANDRLMPFLTSPKLF